MLPKLPGLPRPGFQGVAAQEPGQKVAFQVVSCPTAGVRIADIRTAQPGWWQISGTASIPNLWYWKAEISADGSHWANLVRAESGRGRWRAGAAEPEHGPGRGEADPVDGGGQDGELSGAMCGNGATMTVRTRIDEPSRLDITNIGSTEKSFLSFCLPIRPCGDHRPTTRRIRIRKPSTRIAFIDLNARSATKIRTHMF